MTEQGDWEPCEYCCGSGADDLEPDGRCIFCHGDGEVYVVWDDEDREGYSDD